MTTTDMDRHAVAHLLRRAGFAANPAEIDEYTALGYGGAVERLINYEGIDDSKAEQVAAAMRAATLPYSNPQRPEIGNIGLEVAVWMARLLHTRRPLQEKMTLFWHNHFATSNGKVTDSALMLRQNNVLRAMALTGDFRAMVRQMASDPAMIIWLDNYTNRKGSPNENFARELMELFTLGPGNYTEADVKAAARAFTGWTMDASRNFSFDARAHDAGSKTFLGVTGNLGGEDVIEHILKQAAHPVFMARKLLRFFVYDDPDEATVRRFGDIYARSGFSIKETVRQIFLSAEFLSERARFALVKSPVEFAIGAMRQLSVNVTDKPIWDRVAMAVNNMGQYLYYPPDVGGWPVGRHWLSSNGYFHRMNFAGTVVGLDNILTCQAWEMAQAAGVVGDMNAAVSYFVDALLGADCPDGYRVSLLGFLSQYPQNRPPTASSSAWRV